MSELSLQDRIFQSITEHFSRKSDAVDALSQVLNLSSDAVYRRMRGDTILSPAELEALCLHFRLSLDTLVFGGSAMVVAQYNAITRPVRTFSDYIENFESDLSRVRRLPNAHFYFASVEVPVLTYMFFPELLRFKLYVWGRTTWDLPVVLDRPFSFDLVPEPVIRVASKVGEHYLHMPSTELWSLNICDNTLAQIEYHVYSGGFQEPEDALIICQKLGEWVHHAKSMALAGGKFLPGADPESRAADLHLYHNEMVYNNITAMVDSDVFQIVYAAFCNPNFLTSTDVKICDFTRKWFSNVLGKSVLISVTGEKSREWFFQELQKKIDRVIKRIQLHLSEQG